MNAKPLFVLLLFILFIALFAGGSIGGTDLTPDTPPASPSSGSSGGVDYSVFGGSGSGSGLPITSAPESSPCGSSYTVRAGDTLSRISRSCAVSLSYLLGANPSIRNPNLILVGQRITIYNSSAAPRPTATPKAKPTSTPSKSKKAASSSGLEPGDTVTVFAQGFPPDYEVNIGIGEVGAKPYPVGKQLTGGDGSVSASVKIPAEAKAGQKWVVTISTDKMKVTGTPFEIGK